MASWFDVVCFIYCFVYGLMLYCSSPMVETSPTAGSSGTPPTPAYTTPACYITQQPALKLEQFTKLQLETLFYMFYVLPKDIVQALAGQELSRREWKFHTDLKVWIKTRSAQEQQQSHPGVQFIYFDLNGWDIKPFNGAAIKTLSNGTVDPANINMSTSLLSEQDLRVVLQNKQGNVLDHGSASFNAAPSGMNIPSANFPGGVGMMAYPPSSVSK